MTRLRRTTAAGWAALLAAAAATACTGAPDGPPDEVAGSPQALAAAVLEHYAHADDVVGVAPLFRRDRIRRGDLGVEVTFDRPETDYTHVRVVVTEGPPFGRTDDPCDGPWVCEDVSAEGVAATLLYEGGYPEEDPGLVYAWSEWGDRTVWGYAYGPFVDDEDPSQEVLDLGEVLTAVVTDPAVGFRTSEAYEQVGGDIDDDVWREWHGQGHGAPEPDDYRDWR